jgi:D-arabinose 1-dehydrogenase-like Zn-dependent alcohol dehydrogenase
MLAARMHGYKRPLVLEEVNIPEISSDQVLVRIGGAGMCRSDVQLSDRKDATAPGRGTSQAGSSASQG